MLSPTPMAFKTNLPAASCPALPGFGVIAVSGPDAGKFLQAQLMNDVVALAPGHWHWTGWLTPKGRVIALFALLRIDAESLWLLLPDVDAAGLATQLQRFVFRSKVQLEPLDDLHANGRFEAPTMASGSTIAQVDGVFELDVGGDGGPRCLRIGPVDASDDEALAARWRGFDLQHGLPRLRDAQVETWTPQQLSLDRLRAFSVKKGCYPGQEIVARTHFLGKVKRGLMLVAGTEPFDVGAEVHAAGTPLGTVVSAAPGSEGQIGLAVVPLERDAAAALTVNDTSVKEIPLQEGLAR